MASKLTRFYLVDDDELFHLIHNRFIRQYQPDAEITSFVDPREALQVIGEKAEDPQPTVLLLDVNMPYLSGWEWLAAFSPKAGPACTVRIYILSSSDSPQDRDRLRDYPFVRGYLVKPLSKEALERVSML